MLIHNLPPQEKHFYKQAFDKCMEGGADMLFYAVLYKDPEVVPADLMGITQERYFELAELAVKAFTIGTGRAQEKQLEAVVRIKQYYDRP